MQKVGKFCFFSDTGYCSVSHSTAYLSWETAIAYHTAMRLSDFGIFLCNFVYRNVISNQFDL